MLITVPTTRTVEELAARLVEACASEGFDVLSTVDLRERLSERGQPFLRACFIVEVCHPALTRRAMEAAPETSAAVPCRIAVYEKDDGGRMLATIRPQDLLALIGPAGRETAGVDVERSLRAIMEKAAQ